MPMWSTSSSSSRVASASSPGDSTRLVVRGRGMAERSAAAHEKARSAADDYIRQVAGRSPAAEIGEAKALRDAGAITDEEFDQIKRKVLS